MQSRWHDENQQALSLSIVMNVHSKHFQFDLKNLMIVLEGSQMESLNQQFMDIEYIL